MVESADTGDLKSLARKSLPVQVWFGVLIQQQRKSNMGFIAKDHKGKIYVFESDRDFGQKYGTATPYGLSDAVNECGDNIVLDFQHEYNQESDSIETLVSWHYKG